MSGMSLPVGGLEVGAYVSSGRKRMSGMLGRGPRGLVLTTDDNELWVIDTDDEVARFIGQRVMIDGTAVRLDRLKADWIGPAD
jgi:hypothetical protein